MKQTAGPQRRRGATLEREILDAAWEELSVHGWAGLRMGRVATRAGIGKASLYSRWPTKGALVRAALARASEATHHGSEFADTAADLRAALAQLVSALEGPIGEALRGVVAEARTDVAISPSNMTDEVPVQLLADIAAHGQRVGVLPAGDISVRVLNLGYTLVTHYFLMNGRTPTVEALDDIHSLWLVALGYTNPMDTTL